MTVTSETRPASAEAQTAFTVLAALSLCHGLNDTVQSLLPAIYPLLQQNYSLSFTQIGLLAFAFQVTASLLQPVVGAYTDTRPMFRLSTVGMGASLVGLVMLAFAQHYALLIVAAMMIGVGSSIFHPDSSRVARVASGGRYGFAQSLFQLGGNAGTAIGPLLAALIVLPFGQRSIAWFSILALVAMVLLWQVGTWAKARHLEHKARPVVRSGLVLPRRRVMFTLAVLVVLVFSKQVYMVSLGSFYTFYLIETFGVSVQASQLYLFLFLGAAAAGTFLGGPIGDRVGPKTVIWMSILGALPFALALPHANLFMTAVLSVAAGFIISSAFSAIIVYAQALVPGRVGLISGIFFGLSFGLGGLGAAVLGVVADATSIGFVFNLCALLPALGLLTVFLPADKELQRR